MKINYSGWIIHREGGSTVLMATANAQAVSYVVAQPFGQTGEVHLFVDGSLIGCHVFGPFFKEEA